MHCVGQCGGSLGAKTSIGERSGTKDAPHPLNISFQYSITYPLNPLLQRTYSWQQQASNTSVELSILTTALAQAQLQLDRHARLQIEGGLLAVLTLVRP